MLAMKTLGELLAIGVRFLVIKMDTVLLKRTEPRHVKVKSFILSCLLINLLEVLLATLSSTVIENWSFLESLYAWFTTFTTIGFGDYVHLESYTRKAANGKMSKASLVLYDIFISVPYVGGLSLVSCMLSCLVDSLDKIRHFCDRFVSCFPSLDSLILRFSPCKQSRYSIKQEESCARRTTPGPEIERR